MKRGPGVGLALGLLFVGGCDPPPGGGDSTSTSASDGGGDSTAGGGVDDGGGDGDGDGDGDDDGGDIIGQPDVPPSQPMCDPLDAGACASGEKCTMATMTPGVGYWDTNLCVPAGQDGVGEACCRASDGDCWFEGPLFSDSCDATSFCWGIDPDSHQGRCREFCVGPVADITCPQTQTSCMPLDNGVVTLCELECDPLDVTNADCGPYEVCKEHISGSGVIQSYYCEWSTQGGLALGADCFGDTGGLSCNPGLRCAPAGTAGPACEHDWCCVERCDVTAADPGCSGAGQACIPDGALDPAYAHVGTCAAP